MKMVIERMLKSANLMSYNLFTRWKLATFTDKEKRLQMAMSRKIGKMFDNIERKWRNHLRAGINKIARDCVETNMK